MDEDDVAGYAIDDIRAFIYEHKLTKENFNRLSMAMSMRYSLADLGMELVKLVLENKNES